MKSITRISTSLVIGVSTLFASSLLMAHDMEEHQQGHSGKKHASSSTKSSAVETVAVTLSSQSLLDSEGRSLRLKDDVVGNRIVVVSFVYTSCTTVCPMASAIMSELQTKLGSRLDNDVRLVTLTVDPARDTPSQLKSYSGRFDAKPGWFWLTGSPASVTDALKRFGAYTPNFENHPIMVMIGDGQTGKWSRHYGLAKPEQLLAQVDDYLARRNKAGG